jgi:hypothetical protein
MTIRTLFSPRHSSLWWCGPVHGLAMSLIAVTGILPLSRRSPHAHGRVDNTFSSAVNMPRNFFRRLKNEEKFNFDSALLNRPQIHGEHDSRWKQRKETNSL